MKFVKAKNVKATTNEVVEYFAEVGAKVRIKLLDRTEVLIEGDETSLEFLANLILALVNGGEHSRNIGPKSAGSIFFKEGSTKGLYIHVLPCRHGHPDE